MCHARGGVWPSTEADRVSPSAGSQTCAAANSDQAAVIAFLAEPASYIGVEGVDRVERLETHANLVFLAGSEVWKIKRAVRFPYMDFSTLAKRHAACLREVEINRRFAPQLYLGCVAICRTPAGALAFGSGGEIVEWAVHMRRFEQSALLSNLAARQAIPAEVATQLGDVVHESHQRAERAAPPTGIGPIERVATDVAQALAKAQVFDPADSARFPRLMGDLLKRAAPIARRAGPLRLRAPLPRRSASCQHRHVAGASGALRRHRVRRGDRHHRYALRSGVPADGPRLLRATSRGQHRPQPLPVAQPRRPRPAGPDSAARVPGPARGRARHGDGRPGRAGRS